MRTIIDYKGYGRVGFRINQLMDEKQITVSKMVKLSGMHHRVIQRYYEDRVERCDMDVLARFCYILDCKISDTLFYNAPK